MTEQTIFHNISACAFDKVYQARQQRERAYFVTVAVGLLLAGIGMLVL